MAMCNQCCRANFGEQLLQLGTVVEEEKEEEERPSSSSLQEDEVTMDLYQDGEKRLIRVKRSCMVNALCSVHATRQWRCAIANQ